MKVKDLIDRFIEEMGTETRQGIKPLGVSHLYCLHRLKLIPPLEELEGQRTEETLREPAYSK